MSNVIYLHDKLKSHVYLNVPFCHQRSDSACCGPCCLKMLIDYYDKSNSFTKNSLIALCKTSSEYGTSFRNLNNVLKSIGLCRKKCNTIHDAVEALDRKEPVLTVMSDFKEAGTDHYILITGYHECDFAHPIIFINDPYYGEYALMWFDLESKIKKAGNWMWSVQLKEA